MPEEITYEGLQKFKRRIIAIRDIEKSGNGTGKEMRSK